MHGNTIGHRFTAAMALLALVLTVTVAAGLKSGIQLTDFGSYGTDYLMLNPEVE